MDVFKRRSGEESCPKGSRCGCCGNDKKGARRRARKRMKRQLRRELNI